MAEFLKETYFVALPIVLTAFMGWIGATLNKQQKERSANSRGTMLILRYMLRRYHAEYKHKGYVTQAQYNEFEEMYEAYHELGGNGSVTHMWEEIKRLEIRTDISEEISPYAALLFALGDKL